MTDLKIREEKIIARRKQTSWRDFVKEICSRQPMNVYKYQGSMSRFPTTWREPKIVTPKKFGGNISIWTIGKDFLESISNLYKQQEQMSLMQWFENENCDFAEVYGAKNCYLSFSVWLWAENLLYDFICSTNVRNVFNSISILNNCDNVYQSRIVTNSYNIFYSSNIHQSNNIRFSTNLIWCTECISCSNLENQSYSIENISYPKVEYYAKKAELLLQKDKFNAIYLKVIWEKVDNKLCKDCTGAWLVLCDTVTDGYIGTKVLHGKNLIIAWWEEGAQNLYDCFDVGFQSDHDFYAVHYCWEWSHHIYCSSSISHSSQIFYSYFLENCSFCLGCIGLKNKIFCILNKEYPKEERYRLANKIFEQMHSETSALGADKDWTLWQFFPWSMNPFYFNDTAAYLIDDSFTKEEVMKEWYLRRDEAIKVDIPQWADTITTKDISSYQWFDTNWNWKIDPEILKKVIRDEKNNYYRIVKMEYDFLIKYWLPLPELHWLDRIKLGFRFK